MVDSSISRRIVNEDVGFLHRLSSTHKHSLQACYVYVHDDHTVKIKPLIRSPFGQTSIVIAYTSIIHRHSSETDEIVFSLGRFYLELRNDNY